MSAEPTAKPKRARRSIEQQIAELDRKRKRELARSHARHSLDCVREAMIARDHGSALKFASGLVDALERVVEIENEIAAAREQDGEPAKAAQ